MVERGQVDWEPSGAPRSRRFQDVYCSREDGLAETKAVFLAGCGLPDAWRGRNHFVVGELGFGTGLNILALLQLWRDSRPPGGRLHVFSVEAYPLSAGDAARALAGWPELSDLAAPLLARWPTSGGFHRLEVPELGASIDVAIAEVAEALAAWNGEADAWFLDGFSPAKNPQMWRDEVLALVAQRSAAGARIATFSVAGAVRRGLQAQGFTVAKRPGFGAKGERLEAVLDRPRPSRSPSVRLQRVCIIGAGVAGAALARAFRAQGLLATVIDCAAPGAGASGNPAALVTPRLDAGGGPLAQLHAQAFEHACAIYLDETENAVIARGALQLEAADRDARRFDRIAAGDLFEDGAMQRLSAEEAGARLGEPAGAGGLWIREGLTVEPAAVLAAWLAESRLVTAFVEGLEPTAGAWRLIGPEGALLAEADLVCIAAGFASRRLAPDLPLEPVRGQASIVERSDTPTAAAWGGYVIPTRTGLLFGATHDRGDDSAEVRPGDQIRNLALLARRRPALAAGVDIGELAARAGVRAAAPDHAPLAGRIEAGLFVLGGLGGRGFTLAPLLAEHVVALALGLPSPLPAPLALRAAADRFSRHSA